jgi:hypothetical protein
MSFMIAGQGAIPGAAALAASKSAVFSSAPTPQRFGLHEESRGRQAERAIWNFTAKLLKSGMSHEDIVAKLQETNPGMKFAETQHYIAAGRQILNRDLSGYGSSGGAPIRVEMSFGGVQDAKAFALQKLGELNKAIAAYNERVRTFTDEKATAIRADIWAQVYQDFKANRPEATEAEAIAAADNNLKGYLNREGKFDTGNIRSPLGTLEFAFRLSPWSLIRENEDGTLSLNRTTLTYAGQTILEIGSPVGQNIDNAS